MKHNRQTKIVATLGPQTQSKAKIKSLLSAGVNVFRLNFSHGDHETHKNVVKIIRDIEKERQRPIAIMADLQGPKLRIGVFEKGFVGLKKGQEFRFDLHKAPGNETRVTLPHPEVLRALKKGQDILLDDGKVRMRVIKKGKDYLQTEVIEGIGLSDKKGFNLPGIIVPVPALTQKDKRDLKAALSMGVDWIAQSFVQKPEDVIEAKKLIKNKATLMIKLEKPSALFCLKKLIELGDGVMVARGDLGVEIPPENVPSVQKHIIKEARLAGKPVIVATQMLESMIKNAQPTRAEASDVATAVYDGADAVMLSAETAMGAHPIKAVQIMERICIRTEQDQIYSELQEAERMDPTSDPSDAITTAAYYVAQDIDAKVIVTYTMSGSTALRASRQRPEIPIMCLTPSEQVARQLVLSYGIYPVITKEHITDFAGPAEHAVSIVSKHKLAKKNEYFVMTAGVPFGTPGSTNILRIARI